MSDSANKVGTTFFELFQTQAFLVQLGVFLLLLLAACWTRMILGGKLTKFQGDHKLDMSALNDVKNFKEVFMTYLSAAILEPVLSIADSGNDDPDALGLLMNILELGSILWWIWLLTDAFDCDDVLQYYKYHVVCAETKQMKPDRYSWLHLKDPEQDAQTERRTLSGSLTRDIAIWFNLACILAAWLPGGVAHIDVIHAYLITAFWIYLHHLSTKATSWHPEYVLTFLFPSTALMPLEYCLPLMDGDACEDLEWIESWRNFVFERTGVSLDIFS